MSRHGTNEDNERYTVAECAPVYEPQPAAKSRESGHNEMVPVYQEDPLRSFGVALGSADNNRRFSQASAPPRYSEDGEELPPIDEVEEEESCWSGRCCCKSILHLFISLPIMLTIYVAILMSIRFQFGFDLIGPAGWFVCSLSAFTILNIPYTFLFFGNACRSKEKEPRTSYTFWKYLISSYLFWFILNQLVLALVIPTESFIPDSVSGFSEDLLISSSYYSDNESERVMHACTIENFRLAKVYYSYALVDDDGSTSDYWGDVSILVGGLPKLLKNTDAMTVDETIYLQKTECPSVDLLVHEMFHVYQMKSGSFFENGCLTFWEWLYKQNTERDTMYDYGGEEEMTLQIAKPDGDRKTLSEYNMEQQASIVQDAYIEFKSYADTTFGCTYDSGQVKPVCDIPSPYGDYLQDSGINLE